MTGARSVAGSVSLESANQASMFELLVGEYKEKASVTQTEQQHRALYARYAGKEGLVRKLLLERLAQSKDSEQKRAMGQQGNLALKAIEEIFLLAIEQIKNQELAQQLERHVDLSLPGRRIGMGHHHPLALVLDEVEQIFGELGFHVALGPQIETDFNNFEGLGMPQGHPARSMQDTFYIDEGNLLLRTHTSSVQIRTMVDKEPPFQIMAPGKVYRREDDATHSAMFHQIEGLCIDKQVNFAHVKGVLTYFVERFFGKGTKIRLRPSFFPFTEPSAELDICCYFCQGDGCKTCKGTGYIEILGCGMVDPEVFVQVEKKRVLLGKPKGAYQDYRGFAFGMGIERLAMLRYGIPDLRLFYTGDMRFLSHFLKGAKQFDPG